jgi:HEAT repeat protein
MARSFLVALFGGLLVACSATACDPEPRYEGKPLEYWVERFQKANTDADQVAAAKALQAFGPDAKPAIPLLLEMMLDHSEDYRRLVGWILGNLGSNAKFAVPGLVELLKNKKARDPGAIIRVLWGYGAEAKEAVPILVDLLKDPKLLEPAFETLCAIGPDAKTAIPALKESLNEVRKLPIEPDPVVRIRKGQPLPSELIRRLPGLGVEAVPYLMELLESEDSQIKTASMEALGELGPVAAESAPRLKELLQSKNSTIRLAAATALWKVKKDHVAIQVLEKLTATIEASERFDESVGALAVLQLGEIGPAARSALPTLKKLLAELIAEPRRDLQPDKLEAAIKKIEVGPGTR